MSISTLSLSLLLLSLLLLFDTLSMTLSEPRIREEICIPGSIFKKGCEMCSCSPDGQILSCVPISCKNLKF
ncbi:hypothetical protein Phum_PHUM595810 [Pediculus humanus corporis]|uniref:Pacifastin domain-containing protein n=1 Tax=Pediculus humanus subsp. corporis TaxID=121224 RepID=E0W2L9_PEDHC|nr:uncharacterized protein Phum_PHUM595810 [Pediculus humanus corporis]EEB19875.1 hypothetical protein Phum_PHUM595810 [Pediculus humanus corporis]